MGISNLYSLVTNQTQNTNKAKQKETTYDVFMSVVSVKFFIADHARSIPPLL